MRAATAWAFRQPNVWTVSAETLADNVASQKVLAKAGFLPDGEGKEGPRFQKEKPASQWMLLFLLLGMGAGTVIGLATRAVALAEGIGVCVGLVAGTVMDAREKRIRALACSLRNAAGKAAVETEKTDNR